MEVKIIPKSNHNTGPKKKIIVWSCPRMSAPRMYAGNTARTALVIFSAFRYKGET